MDPLAAGGRGKNRKGSIPGGFSAPPETLHFEHVDSERPRMGAAKVRPAEGMAVRSWRLTGRAAASNTASWRPGKIRGARDRLDRDCLGTRCPERPRSLPIPAASLRWSRQNLQKSEKRGRRKAALASMRENRQALGQIPQGGRLSKQNLELGVGRRACRDRGSG